MRLFHSELFAQGSGQNVWFNQGNLNFWGRFGRPPAGPENRTEKFSFVSFWAPYWWSAVAVGSYNQSTLSVWHGASMTSWRPKLCMRRGCQLALIGDHPMAGTKWPAHPDGISVAFSVTAGLLGAVGA